MRFVYSQNAVSAYFTSKQILPFGFVESGCKFILAGYRVQADIIFMYNVYHYVILQKTRMCNNYVMKAKKCNFDTLYYYFSIRHTYMVKPLTAKLFNLNFHPLDVVSRLRDPQLQVSENYSDLTKWWSTLFKYCWLMSHFIFKIFKRWYLMR